jgi:protein SCO1/2
MNRRQFFGLGALPLAATPVLAAAPPRPPSLAAQRGWLPNIPLVTHTGETVRFYDDLIRDRTVLFNFFVVACPDGTCPSATAKLRAAQDMLGERMGRDVFFYSITLRPAEETPAVLREYASLFEPKPGWLFLSGEPQDIDFLRRSQGFADNDPERDKDVTLHTAMARYGDDRLERWGALSLRSSPKNIASTFKWLTA